MAEGVTVRLRHSSGSASHQAERSRVRLAMRHPDRLGAGAARRRRLFRRNPQGKIHAVLSEFKRGTLRSGSGGHVRSRKQAIAIALSEARESGARISQR